MGELLEVKPKSSNPELTFRPVTKSRWHDFERLFGTRGACGGCWCMTWRVTRAAFEKGKGPGNKRAIKKHIFSGSIPGILVYEGRTPIGWCSIAPRDEFVFLGGSRILAPVDDRPVWSVSCIFIEKHHRRSGLSVQLLRAAVEYVKRNGGKIVEGYPVVPYADNMPAAFAWTGTHAAFLKAGFKEALRRSKSRPIMRFQI